MSLFGSVPNRPPGVGTPRSIADILANFDYITDKLDGSILDGDNFSVNTNSLLGLNSTGTKRSGVSKIVTTESRTNTAYGTLPAADQVTNIFVPTNGLVFVYFFGQITESVGGAGRAAIFAGANQVKLVQPNAASVVMETAINTVTPGSFESMVSSPVGLSIQTGGTANESTPPLTGEALALANGVGNCHIIRGLSGTFTISVQVKSTSGSVSMRERELWVWSKGFS